MSKQSCTVYIHFVTFFHSHQSSNPYQTNPVYQKFSIKASHCTSPALKTCCVSSKLKCRKIKHVYNSTLFIPAWLSRNAPQNEGPYFFFLLSNPRSRCFSWRCTAYLLPCIQLNNLSAAIATAEEHRAAPPACAMDVTRSNDQSEVPILLYKQCEDGGMEWVGFQHHASASNRTRGSSVFVILAWDWSRSFTFQ